MTSMSRVPEYLHGDVRSYVTSSLSAIWMLYWPYPQSAYAFSKWTNKTKVLYEKFQREETKRRGS